jgi:hypothetical protein
MVTRCASYVRGRVLRVTRLDACGRLVYGPDSVVTSSGFVSVAYTANIDDGEEINLLNANGDRCTYVPAKPSFLGYTVEITFCNVDPDLFAMMTGQRVVTDAFGDVVGFTMDTAVASDESAFALEVWAGSPTTNGCVDGASGTFGYVLLPFLQGGVVGDFTIENAEVTFTVSGAATRDGNAWGVGPYDVVLGADSLPTTLPDPLTATEHLYFSQTGVAPPEAQCGARPLLDPDADPITDVTVTPEGLSVEFDPVPASTDPWWVDFGDGTWDYSEYGSAITHVYDTEGTYTWIAYRNDSTVTGDVDVEAPPTILSIDPDTGPEAGSTATVLTGTDFTGSTAVNFDGVPGTAFSVVNDTTINVTTPAGTGVVDVEVVNPNGNDTLTGGFTYTP